MTRIQIEHVGPITQVDFELNKINVLMGTQSSGKSTIAKIISFCQWAEKRFILDGEFEYDVKEQLLEFHRLSENYFNDKSLFVYESDFTKISYKGKELEKTITKKSIDGYKKSRNIYIPSERNFVSVIPNLSKYKETNDNIMSFVYDWFAAKRVFSTNNRLSILNLGVDFYNKSEGDDDILLLSNQLEILLREGSSGLQSVIPLIAIIEYLTEYIYNRNISNSVEEKDLLENFIIDSFKKNIDLTKLKEISTFESFNKDDFKTIFDLYLKTLDLKRYNNTNFIIEEPEQNLFPSTQRDLINYLFEKMNGKRNHTLVLTTHSPYILYSINNCLMGYNVKEKIEMDEMNEIKSKDSWINPDLVSIWQIEKGYLNSVKDSITNTVTKHYFNEITRDIMDEYFTLLSHFEND